jgi:hypothetical protein
VCGVGVAGVVDGANARSGAGCVGCVCSAVGVGSLLISAADGTGVDSVGCGCDAGDCCWGDIGRGCSGDKV